MRVGARHALPTVALAAGLGAAWWLTREPAPPPDALEVVVPAAEMRIRTEGAPLDGGGWNLWSNHQVADWFEVGPGGRIEVTVVARGTLAEGVAPVAALRVLTLEGLAFERTFTIEPGDDRAYVASGSVPSGPCVVSLSYTNDRPVFPSGEDRNILLQRFRVAGASRLERIPDLRPWSDERIRETRRGRLVVEGPPGVEVRVRQLRHELELGAAVWSELVAGRARPEASAGYRSIVAEHFTAVSPAEAYKWAAVEDVEGRRDWDSIERLADFCRENGLALRGHTVLGAPPGWIPEWARSLGRDALLPLMHARVDDALTRFTDLTVDFDMINEMLPHPGFRRRLGFDAIAGLFQRAARANPDAILYLNEYGVLSGGKLQAYEHLIEELLAAGAPVGGIGIQAHFAHAVPDPLTMTYVLDRLGRFGLPIKITEFDVQEASESRQADAVERVLRTAFAHPAVAGMHFWSIWEGDTWRPGTGLWKESFEPSAAARRLKELAFGAWWTDTSGRIGDDGRLELDAYHGTLRVEAGAFRRDIELSRDFPSATVAIPAWTASAGAP